MTDHRWLEVDMEIVDTHISSHIETHNLTLPEIELMSSMLNTWIKHKALKHPGNKPHSFQDDITEEIK